MQPVTVSKQEKPESRTLLRSVLIGVTVISITLAAVSAFHRLPWSDEGWFSSASYNLAHKGFFGTTVMETAGTTLTRIEQHTYWVMPLFLLGQAAWYTIAPHSVFWTRVFTIAWVPVAVFGLYLLLLKILGDRRIAVTGALLLALDYVLIDNAGFARPDVMCMALGIGGMAVYAHLRCHRFLAAMAAGNALVALSGLTHPNGIIHLAGLCVLVLWLDRNRLGWKPVAAAAAPYLVAGVMWAAYISVDPQAFADQMIWNGTNGRVAKSWNPIKILWSEIRDRYLVAYGLSLGGVAIFKSFALFSYLAALVGLLAAGSLRRQPRYQLLLLLVAVYFTVLCVFNQKLSYYLVHIVPLYAAVLAVWVVWLWDHLPRWRLAVAAWIAVLLLLQSGGIVLRARQRSYIEQQRQAVRFLLNRAKEGSLIIGSASLLYEMNFDPRLLDSPFLGTRGGRTGDFVIIDELYRIAFEAWARKRPVEYRRIQARLAEYDLIYDKPEYKIYQRKTVAR